MGDILKEFLALKRASTPGAHAGDPGPHHAQQSAGVSSGNSEQPPRPGEISPGTGTLVLETDLSRYFQELLAAHPSPVRDRQALGEYLARGVIHRYGNPEAVRWDSGRPVTARNRGKIPWTLRCPAGHLTDEALETNQVVCIVCETCEKIYDTKECALVLRQVSSTVPAAH
jgi:hypothetical protein